MFRDKPVQCCDKNCYDIRYRQFYDWSIWLTNKPPRIVLSFIILDVRLLEPCAFVPLRHSLQCDTGPEFAAKLFIYLYVHLHFIFVWANVMKEYAGSYITYMTMKTWKQYFNKNITFLEHLMITQVSLSVFEWSKNISTCIMLVVRKCCLWFTCLL